MPEHDLGNEKENDDSTRTMTVLDQTAREGKRCCQVHQEGSAVTMDEQYSDERDEQLDHNGNPWHLIEQYNPWDNRVSERLHRIRHTVRQA